MKKSKMVNRKLQSISLYLPIIICTIISYTILYNGSDNITDGIIGIAIALMVVGITLISIYLNFKREDNAIKDIEVDTSKRTSNFL